MKKDLNAERRKERKREAANAINDVKNYLEIEKGLKVEDSDIIIASLKLAQRMGPGRYGIYWELKDGAKV